VLQVLLHGKLERWLSKDPCSIEDLLTSVVLGSAWYADPQLALVPFLARAVDDRGRRLEDDLHELRVVKVRFWPTWGAVELDAEDTEEDELPDEADASDEIESAARVVAEKTKIALARSQPEVIVEFERIDGHRFLLLVEAKLYGGKSSHPVGGGKVNDQLGRYWLQLEKQAAWSNATPLGVVYVTTSMRFPRESITATQSELQEAGCGPARLYWLSWREFPAVVPENAPPILRDCVTLLRDRWQLYHVQMEPWSAPPTNLPKLAFRRRATWGAPPAPAPWTFTERSST
jgi:hypothetical protein